ncbi:hypothetical protein LIL_40053 (plasmid) [Leptospira interrogans serovar Linhai str. 56609]|nr:hypothetical protein LIL_40053 [Leptospira interrogans serovar Linhai str. 56609]
MLVPRPEYELSKLRKRSFIFLLFGGLKIGIKFMVILEKYRNFLNLNLIRKWLEFFEERHLLSFLVATGHVYNKLKLNTKYRITFLLYNLLTIAENTIRQSRNSSKLSYVEFTLLMCKRLIWVFYTIVPNNLLL